MCTCKTPIHCAWSFRKTGIHPRITSGAGFSGPCTSLLFAEMLAEEGEHLAPAIHGSLRPVKRPMPIPDAVTGAIVAVELVGFSVLLQRGLMLIHLLGARRAVVVAENADQRTAQVLGHIDRRDRCLGVELFL